MVTGGRNPHDGGRTEPTSGPTGPSGTNTSSYRTVDGYCPMGCGSTLYLAEGGFVTCWVPGCPDRAAVGEILSDPESEHLVTFTSSGFTVRHPLRERIDDALQTCDLLGFCARWPPARPGTYRLRPRLDGEGLWTFEWLGNSS